MTKRGKTDFLELVKSGRRKAEQQAGQPQHLLALIQQQMLGHCERLLEAMFLASDDAFYERSDQANSNDDANLYFDAMRKVRLAKPAITHTFAQNLENDFRRLTEGPHTQTAANPEAITAQNLSLMDGDELETDLALKNMVSHARNGYREPLHEVHVRLKHLLPDTEMQDANNPLDPHQIARAFIDACTQALQVDIKARLILFKLFEKHVLKSLVPIYAHANQLLADAGIVPKVPRQLQKAEDALPTPAQNPQPAAQSATQEDAPQTPTEAGFNLSLEALVSLMTTAHGATPQAPVVNCYIVTAGNPGPIMTAPQLTSLLTRSQLLTDRQLSKGPKNLVPQVVNGLLRKADIDAPQALDNTNEAVINLVSLFFDQILDDDNLPLAVYALICRLQIPILKIALQDASFFSRPDHSARRLINTITATGVGFNENKLLERDPVYRKMADIVQVISRESRIEESLFGELHDDLTAVIRAEQHKVSIVERRTSQCATGRSRIRNAKKDSQNLLYSKLHGTQLPFAISEFLTTTWLQVLIITHLKHGHESAAWFANAEIVADLVWLCQRHQDLRSLQHREQLQPSLMQRVEAGLETAIENPTVRSAKVHELHDALHPLNTESDKVVYGTLSREQREALGQAAEQPPSQAQSAAVQPSREYLEQARQLPEGTWVEFEDEHSGAKWRYKLAIKVDSEAYIFVNRMGFKTLERSCQQVACDMQAHKMKPLACNEFFDRMMNKVLSRINDAA